MTLTYMNKLPHWERLRIRLIIPGPFGPYVQATAHGDLGVHLQLT